MSRLLSASLLVAVFGVAEIQCQTQRRIFLDQGVATSTGANTFPWSREKLRYQTIFPGAKFGNKPCVINDILVAPQFRNPAIKTAVYDDIEIRMGRTAQSTPTTNWSTNNPNAKTVYRGPLRVTFEKGVWRGMGLPNSFLFLPTNQEPHLCVEFIMWKFNPTHNATTVSIRAVTAPSTVRRAFYFNWTVAQNTPPTVGSSAAEMGLICDNGNFVVTEQGCTSSSNTRLAISSDTFPQATKPISVILTGGQPRTSAFLAIGLSDTKGFGGSLPLDGTPFGAPGCFVWNEALVLLGTTTDTAGKATIRGVVPASTGFARLYAHWWNYDKGANVLGVTTSNYAKILLGN